MKDRFFDVTANHALFRSVGESPLACAKPGLIGRFALALSLLGLASCALPKAHFQTIRATLLDKDDRPGEAFDMIASYDPWHTVQLLTLLPDGERFSGPLIQGFHIIKRTVSTWHPPVSSGGRKIPGYFSEDTVSYVERDPEGEAILSGNREHRLNCQFTFSDPYLWVFGSGCGECRLSDERKITLDFQAQDAFYIQEEG